MRLLWLFAIGDDGLLQLCRLPCGGCVLDRGKARTAHTQIACLYDEVTINVRVGRLLLELVLALLRCRRHFRSPVHPIRDSRYRYKALLCGVNPPCLLMALCYFL